MTRWSLSNYFFSISHDQFVAMTTQLKDAAEQSFGTACNFNITARKQPKLYTTFVDDEIQGGIDILNKPHVLLQTDQVAAITPDIWKEAKYVEVSILPADKEKAPFAAFAHAEFKGTAPREATFYVQPDGKTVMHKLMAAHPRSIVADGYGGNGVRDGAVPFGIG